MKHAWLAFGLLALAGCERTTVTLDTWGGHREPHDPPAAKGGGPVIDTAKDTTGDSVPPATSVNVKGKDVEKAPMKNGPGLEPKW